MLVDLPAKIERDGMKESLRTLTHQGEASLPGLGVCTQQDLLFF